MQENLCLLSCWYDSISLFLVMFSLVEIPFDLVNIVIQWLHYYYDSFHNMLIFNDCKLHKSSLKLANRWYFWKRLLLNNGQFRMAKHIFFISCPCFRSKYAYFIPYIPSISEMHFFLASYIYELFQFCFFAYVMNLPTFHHNNIK